jgi:hypothetical protein
MVIAIPSLLQVKGWHTPPDVCGGGVIALLAQGDPPHPRDAQVPNGLLWELADGSFSGQPTTRQPILESDQNPEAAKP